MSEQFIQHFFTIWVLILGVYGMTKPDGPFGFFFTWMYDEEEELRSLLFEPFTECLCCMSSFWTCIYFGVLHGLDLNLVIFTGYFTTMALFCAIDFIFDWVAKWCYLVSVGVFICLLPENSVDAAVCLVGVFGVNYQIERVIWSIKLSNFE